MWLGLIALGALQASAPERWLPSVLVSFRRDWGFGKQTIWALATTLVQWGGGIALAALIIGGWSWAQRIHGIHLTRAPELTASILLFLGVLWRWQTLEWRTEIFKQGRGARWPMALALAAAGPSEFLAFFSVQTYARWGQARWMGASVLFGIALLAVTAGIYWVQAWRSERPALVLEWVPEEAPRGLRVGQWAREAGVSATLAAVAIFGSL